MEVRRERRSVADIAIGEHEQLDRTSPEPAYSQLARLLREKIASGELRPGERIPSVPELSASFAVAAMTVRQAIDQLNREGVIVRERGLGTFVKPPSIGAAMFGLEDLQRQMTDDAVQVRVLRAQSAPASPRVAARLDVQRGERVISIKRLLLRDEAPIFYHSEYLIRDPRRPLVEAELGVTSLRGLFSGVDQVDVKNGQLTLHASVLAEGEAEYLGEPAGTPAWVIEHLFKDFDNKPVSWGRFICRADRLTMKAQVGITD
jgi:DNA-binding GntR family transcriptional regulator